MKCHSAMILFYFFNFIISFKYHCPIVHTKCLRLYIFFRNIHVAFKFEIEWYIRWFIRWFRIIVLLFWLRWGINMQPCSGTVFFSSENMWQNSHKRGKGRVISTIMDRRSLTQLCFFQNWTKILHVAHMWPSFSIVLMCCGKGTGYSQGI